GTSRCGGPTAPVAWRRSAGSSTPPTAGEAWPPRPCGPCSTWPSSATGRTGWQPGWTRATSPPLAWPSGWGCDTRRTCGRTGGPRGSGPTRRSSRCSRATAEPVAPNRPLRWRADVGSAAGAVLGRQLPLRLDQHRGRYVYLPGAGAERVELTAHGLGLAGLLVLPAPSAQQRGLQQVLGGHGELSGQLGDRTSHNLVTGPGQRILLRP